MKRKEKREREQGARHVRAQLYMVRETCTCTCTVIQTRKRFEKDEVHLPPPAFCPLSHSSPALWRP